MILQAPFQKKFVPLRLHSIVLKIRKANSDAIVATAQVVLLLD
jgi:hypothetical protein